MFASSLVAEAAAGAAVAAPADGVPGVSDGPAPGAVGAGKAAAIASESIASMALTPVRLGCREFGDTAGGAMLVSVTPSM